MTPNEKLMEQARTLLKERGQKAVEVSKQYVLKEKLEYATLREALRYFMEELWFDILHPALLSLACEAVGGNPEETINFGAAIVLLAGGADIHDDIIDQSIVKGSKKTVFGKFGRDIAILAGDALLLKGLYLLHEACEHLPGNEKKEILKLMRDAVFEVSGAEAKEATLRGRTDILGQEYLDIINRKVAAAEATTRIGAILGGGTKSEITVLGHYGRTYGVLLTLRDEFIDVFEAEELKNRVENEVLPLPILLAFHDAAKKTAILQLLKGQVTEDNIEQIVDLSLNDLETIGLTKEMKRMVQEESFKLSFVKNCNSDLKLLLESTLEDI